MIKIDKKKLVFNIFIVSIIISIFIINYFFTWDELLTKIYAILMLALSFIFLIMMLQYKELVITSVFVFHCNYSVVISVYFGEKSELLSGLFNQFTNEQLYGLTISLLTLFMCVVTLMVYNYKIKNEFIKIQFKENRLMFWFIEAVLILIFIFAIDHTIGSHQVTPIYEYSTIFFIVLMYYSGRNRKLRYITICTVFLFCIMSFFKGNRVEAICFLIVLYIMYFSEKFSAKFVFVAAIAASFGLEILGYAREGGAFSDIVSRIVEGRLAQNTAVAAYIPTLAIIDLRERVQWFDGLGNLAVYLKYILLGSSGITDFNLIDIARKYYYHLGGGLSFSFFYYWFREFGVIVYAYIFGKIYKSLYTKSNKYIKFLLIYLCATVPRWYLYGPATLLRGAYLFSIVYFALIYVPTKVFERRTIND